MTTTANARTIASLDKADARFSRSNLLRLSDDMMPFVLEEMVLTARHAKVAIDKLTDKHIQAAIHTAREALIQEPTDEQLEADAALQDSIIFATGEADFAAENAMPAEVMNDLPTNGHARFVDTDGEVYSEIEVDPLEAEARGMKPVKVVKQVHTSHTNCAHVSTKVARANCRRARATKKA